MRVLIAEDDPVTRRIIQSLLIKWDYDVIVSADGLEAWEMLQLDDAPSLALIDWMMPKMNGIEVCERVRKMNPPKLLYIILLTAKDRKEDLVLGLKSGADDYISKPFDIRELRARIQVGERVVELQRALSDRVKELEEALSKVKQLQGLLPICSYCKKVRNDKNYWEQVENYVAHHSEVQFSHGICPDCYQRVVENEIKNLSHRA